MGAMRVPALVATVVLLTGCGASSDEEQEPLADSPATSSAARPTATTTTQAAPTTISTLSPEAEADLVAGITASSFEENSEVLSTELVKSNRLVEAQTDFRFDGPTRTLVLAVTSVFDTGRPDLAYDLAADFAPVYWGPEAAVVRPESLVTFSVTVDDSTYRCKGPTMAALADRELSADMFVQQCGAN
jgi:hypothetical protein